MPQLIGVNTVSDTVIEYEGYRYEKTEGPAREGDIVRNDEHYSFMPAGAFYLVNEDEKIVDADGDKFSFDEDENTLFRCKSEIPVPIASITDTLAEKRAELERLQAEIAELEAQEAEERRPEVGDWVRVELTEIGRVIEIDNSSVPIYVNSVLGESGWYHESEVEKITPAEARAALIAQIDAMFDGMEAN